MVRSLGTDPLIVWIPGHVGITGNEKADIAAKEGAVGSEPLEGGKVSVAWARQKDSVMWSEAKSDAEWGQGRLREWPLRLVRNLIRIRQAVGPCSLCKKEEREGNITFHIMCECPELEEARGKAGLFNPAGVGEERGHAGWNVWLGKSEVAGTRAFVREVGRAWKAINSWPLENSLEIPWNEVEEGEDGLED